MGQLSGTADRVKLFGKHVSIAVKVKRGDVNWAYEFFTLQHKLTREECIPIRTSNIKIRVI